MRVGRNKGEGTRLVCLRGTGICLRGAVLEYEMSEKKSLEEHKNHKIIILSIQIRCRVFNGERNTLATLKLIHVFPC